MLPISRKTGSGNTLLPESPAHHSSPPNSEFKQFLGSVQQAAQISEEKAGILQLAFQHYSTGENLEEALSIEGSSRKKTIKLEELFNPFFNQLSKAELVTMSVKTDLRPMNMEQFIEKFTRILGNSSMIKTPNGAKMILKLYPEQLGALRIELLQQNGVMTAKILSSTQAVKELIEQNSHQLKQAFSQQQLIIDKIDVTSSETQQQLFDRGMHQDHQKQNQSDEQKQNQPAEEDKASFVELLIDAEIEV